MPAVRALSVKIGDMAFDCTVKILPGKDIDVVQIRHVQIHNPIAAVADEMMVGSQISVKPVRADSGRELAYLADFRKQGQIAVHGAQADIGKIFFEVCVNGFGRGVIIIGRKKIFDRFPLPAVF